ncbi:MULTISPECIES: L,D-transpeptidase family protein [Metabacillus]|nr:MULTISPECIES: L,D-transpeptidase family protein [Metabacillus]
MRRAMLIFLLTLIIAISPFISIQTSAATPSVESQLNQLKGGISQVIIATTDKTSSRNAEVSFYNKKNGKWVRVYSKMSGVVGKNGITTNKKEGDGKTPKGVYNLSTSFGTATKPSGLKLPYTKTNKYYYWIDDVKSNDYNKMIYYKGNADKRWNSYEKLTHSLYSHAVVIDYNTSPILKGKGSAIFLHTRTSKTQYTLGCVAIYKDSLVKIMKQLDPKLNPHIIISEKGSLNKTISEFTKGMTDDKEENTEKQYNYFSPTKSIPVYKHMTGNATIGTLYKGEIFPIIEDEFINWYKVKLGSTYGYIKKANTKGVSTIDRNKLTNSKALSKSFTAKNVLYVKANTEGNQITIGKIQKGISYPIISESENWYQIDFSGRIGYVWKANTSLDEGYFSPKNNIDVYKHMTGNDTIGTLYKDEVYPIIDDQFVNWYKVKIGNTLGYIKKDETRYLTNVSVPSLNNGSTSSSIKVTAISDLYVKQNITGKQITFGKINKGVVYPILEETGNWYKIDFLGRIGFVWKFNASILK